MFREYSIKDCARSMRQSCSESVVLPALPASRNPKTSLVRALSPTTPTYVFPAMNTLMYEHPLTAEHLRIVREVVGYEVVGPIGKTLACGDVGKSLSVV